MLSHLLRVRGSLTARHYDSSSQLRWACVALLIGILNGSTIAVGQGRLMKCPSEAFRSPCEGVQTFANGTRYIGEFNDGMPNGQGKLIFTNGAQYEGQVRDGVPNGQGDYLYSNGMHFSGQFANGIPNGGTLTLPDGRQLAGEFKDGKWVEKRVSADAAEIPH